MFSRRDFIHRSAAALLLAGARRGLAQALPRVVAPLNPGSLRRFVEPLPMPAVARAASAHPDPDHPGRTIAGYRLEMRECLVRVHPDLPPTRMWGFEGAVPGPTIEVRSGEGIMVEWVNRLPAVHMLPIDHTIEGAGANLPEVRTVVHVHGGRTPPDSDGYPENWYAPGGSAVCHYPCRQEATMLWYHDHAMGINRLNIYAGLLGAFFVRDATEAALGLPSGNREIPLVICDRLLSADGQLSYPTSGDPASPWVPEVFGDAVLINGRLFPYLEVAPTLYRLRLLNGSNSRFYNLSLSDGAEFALIGADQGLLAAPLAQSRLHMAPGERADLLMDFAPHAGANLTLRDGVQDLMQFRVAAGPRSAPSRPPARLRPVERLLETSAVAERRLSLDEYEDERGHSRMMLLNATRWKMPITEKPRLGTTEIWSFVNTTDDTHPIHLHLVRFQLLDRQRFDTFAFNTRRELHFTGPRVPADPAESGWKDTARADPGMVTRIIVRFEGYAGRYVWHCHILEHEDNEMMRPYEVLP